MASRKAKKDQRRRKRKRLEGLKRRSPRALVGDSPVAVELPGTEKMSDALARFVEPYLGFTDSEESYRRLLSLGVVAWNAALLSGDERRQMIDDTLGHVRGSEAEKGGVRQFIDDLVRRKQAEFAADRRPIVDFELTDTGTGYHLSVVWMLQPPPDS